MRASQLFPPKRVLLANGFIPTCLVSGAPKSAARTQYLTSVLQQTPASGEFWPTGGLFPSADKRSSFGQWPGATPSRQEQADRKASTIPRGSTWETDRHL